MKIATFNVNGVNGRLPRLVEWLDETAPDVACLQEIKTGDATFPALAIEAAGYRAVWHGQRAHHGVAILSRVGAPREVRRGVPGDDADGQARYLEADVGGMRVASVYLPNGNPQPGPKFDYKLAWFERLIGHAQALIDAGIDAVLAGDFNVVPTDADIYNWWLWRFDAVLQPETRAAWQRLLAQGWVDATRQLHPRERIYTFWVNAGAFARNAGFRMDFVLLTPALADRLVATGVDREQRGREKPSDHAPVWVELGRPTRHAGGHGDNRAMSLESVRTFLAEHAPDIDILQTTTSTATVALAAAAHGVAPAQIAKTLSLRLNGEPILVVMGGEARLDNRKFKDRFAAKAKMLDAAEVEAATGHPVGGVCPIGLARPLKVYADVSLRAFEVVVPAAGDTHAALRIAPERLAELAGAEWIDVAQG